MFPVQLVRDDPQGVAIHHEQDLPIDVAVFRNCRSMICGSLAHCPVETNQNHRPGRALNNARYLFMVLLYLLQIAWLASAVVNEKNAMREEVQCTQG